MTNKEKLEALSAFLKENNIVYYPHYRGSLKVTPDLYIPKHKIMVKISEGEEKDTAFFKAVRYKYHPLFIREGETSDFVIEKTQNLLIDIMKMKQKLHDKMAKKKGSK